MVVAFVALPQVRIEHARAEQASAAGAVRNFFQGFWRQPDLRAQLIYRSAILALAHCYHSRLQTPELREQYLRIVAERLARMHVRDFDTVKQIKDVIKTEQMDYLNRMVRIVRDAVWVESLGIGTTSLSVNIL